MNFRPSLSAAGELEQRDVTVGFVPITCSSPISNASAMGVFEQFGLNVTMRRFTGWGELWIAFAAGELDATQMLIPMPLGIHHNFAAGQRDVRMPYITNVNGQAITLATRHRGRVHGSEDFKGLVLSVPFDYSGHNLLLRDYLTTGGLDPDDDVEIRGSKDRYSYDDHQYLGADCENSALRTRPRGPVATRTCSTPPGRGKNRRSGH